MAARDDELRKLPVSSVHPAQEEEEATKAMSGSAGAGVADTAAPAQMASACYFCSGMPAVVYCRADSAGLCLPCDRHVHGANTVSSRHARAPLCAVCRGAAATACRRAGQFVCSDCDFEEEERNGAARGREIEPPLHDRGMVEGYTGCPSVGELAAILGVHGCDEKAAAADGGDEGWWSAWEEPQVLSLDDVIVPTTSCHGLQPLLTPSSPMIGELDGEVLRQLGELAKSEAATQVAAYVEAEPAGDQLPTWASSEYAIGHGDLGAFGTETSYEAASMAVTSCEQEAWIATDCNDPTDARDAVITDEAAHEQVPVSSSAEPSLSSFVDVSDVCPSMSRVIDNGSHDPSAAMAVAPAQAQPKNGGYDIAYPDRGTVISRYKEKRKNRRFGKQIRYESRKARADGRLRIKGRFAKSS